MSNVKNLGVSIRHGATWLFLGGAGGQVLGFLIGIFLARLLAPSDFGMLVTISVFTGIGGFFAGGGMGQALVRAKEATKSDFDVVFTMQLMIGCVVYAIYFFSAPWFAEWYGMPLYAELLRVSALSFIMRPFVNLPGNILYREMRFKAQSVVKVGSLFTSSTVSIAMAYEGYGVWSLIVGGVVGSLFNAVVMMYITKWRPGVSVDFQRAGGIARYGFMVTLGDILVYLRNQTSAFILSRTLGPASVGLYNKGESMAKIPHSFITGSVYHVLFRAVAVEQDNLDKCRYLLYRSIGLVAVYATPFYIGFLWLAEPIITGLYGDKWSGAALPLSILAMAWPFWLMENLSGAVLDARNWLAREVPAQASTLVVMCLAIIIGLPYGIKGVALGILGSSVFSALYLHGLVIQCIRAKWRDFFKALIPAALLNSILVGVLFVVEYLCPRELHAQALVYVAVMGVSGGLVYVVSLLYLPIPALATEQERWKKKLNLPMLKLNVG